MKYKRILLKLSGEALQGSRKVTNIDPAVLEQYCAEIKRLKDEKDVELAIVIGGGNIFGEDRPKHWESTGFREIIWACSQLLSMQWRFKVPWNATVMYTRLMSGIKMEQVCEPFIRRRAIRHLEKGRIVIFGAGIGNPYFTTDSTASLTAIEVQADVVLKGTRVDGVYTKDPEKFPTQSVTISCLFRKLMKKI